MTFMSPGKLRQGELSVEDHAFYGLVWAGHTLMDRVGRHLMREHRLPLSWFEVLLRLSQQREAVSVSYLSACTMLSPSQVSRVLDTLGGRGIIARQPSGTDARAVQVTITDDGRALFAKADRTRRECLADVFTDRLGQADLTALVRVWDKLKEPAPEP
jgi:DNA-binding MarR family transcriptional regulator